MRTDLFDYVLPPELIAQDALEPRDAARMLAADPRAGEPAHVHIRDLPCISATCHACCGRTISSSSTARG
jgi:S-adenosylmethionine:tRNA-ribosyltransferase-isomerase (queuine synthetase)